MSNREVEVLDDHYKSILEELYPILINNNTLYDEVLNPLSVRYLVAFLCLGSDMRCKGCRLTSKEQIDEFLSNHIGENCDQIWSAFYLLPIISIYKDEEHKI